MYFNYDVSFYTIVLPCMPPLLQWIGLLCSSQETQGSQEAGLRISVSSNTATYLEVVSKGNNKHFQENHCHSPPYLSDELA